MQVIQHFQSTINSLFPLCMIALSSTWQHTPALDSAHRQQLTIRNRTPLSQFASIACTSPALPISCCWSPLGCTVSATPCCCNMVKIWSAKEICARLLSPPPTRSFYNHLLKRSRYTSRSNCLLCQLLCCLPWYFVLQELWIEWPYPTIYYSLAAAYPILKNTYDDPVIVIIIVLFAC